MKPPMLALVTLLALAGACASGPQVPGPATILRTEAPDIPTAELRAAAAQDPGFDVEILEFPGGKPLAGVEVRASTSIDASDFAKTDACMARPDAIFKSDEHGIVHVAGLGEHIVLAAQHGDHWGYGMFSLRELGVRRLVLVPDRSLRVQVVDAQGKPTPGVPVSLLVGHGAWQSQDMVTNTSGAEGIAVMPHAEYFMCTYETGWPTAQPTTQFAAALAFPLSNPVTSTLPGSHVPKDVVRLVLPPTGEVEVHCTEADGSAARLEFPVALRIPGAAELEAGDSLSGSRVGTETPGYTVNAWVARTLQSGFVGTCTAPLEQGRALFTHVELGLQLDAGVRRNYTSTHVDVRFEGPKKAGERVVVELSVGAGKASFLGRVHLPDGRPLANGRLTLEEIDHPPPGGWKHPGFNFSGIGPDRVLVGAATDLFTDAQGFVRFDLEPTSAEKGAIELALTCDRLSAGAIGTLVAPADFGAGSHELGDLVLAPAPILFAGTVSDNTGRAIAGAEISLGSVIQETFLWPYETVCRTDAAGRFEIRTFNQYPSDHVTLYARADGYVPREYETYSRDRTHFDVTLPRTARIHGHLLLPEGDRMSGYGITGSFGEYEHGRTTLGASGEFTIDELRPGWVHISAIAYSSSEPGAYVKVAAVEAEVRAGETLEIPPIDLRTKARPKR